MVFSIIVPVYKIPYELLRRSLDSIVSQTYSDLDIILIDDGSPDECPDICDDYAKRDSRIRVIHQENCGLSVVRNVGVKAAKGEWVSFVDGDDWIEPDTYSHIARLVKKFGKDVDIIAWDCYADFGNSIKRNHFFGGEVATKIWHDKLPMIDTMLPDAHKSSMRYAIFDVTWARVYRRSLLIENNIWNIPGLKRAQDLIFNLEVFEFAKGMYYENLPLYHYVLNTEAASRKYDQNIVNKMLQFGTALKTYVDSYHPNDSNFKQRMYVKLMPKIVECFGQFFIPYSKEHGIKNTLALIRNELEAPLFREAAEKIDTKKSILTMKIFQWLLQRRLYRLLFYICKVQVERKTRWMTK